VWYDLTCGTCYSIIATILIVPDDNPVEPSAVVTDERSSHDKRINAPVGNEPLDLPEVPHTGAAPVLRIYADCEDDRALKTQGRNSILRRNRSAT
jgi:hypothetical protein